MSLGQVHQALSSLRSHESVADLVAAVPQVVHGLGFNRVLLSRLRGKTWIARSGFVVGDVTMRREMVRIGREVPGRTDAGWPEGDVVRRRAAVLVHDAQRNPRVHPQLKALMSTRDYVVAPVIIEGRVIGLLHADQHETDETLTPRDRDLLALFAAGLGFVVERAMLREQLIALRCRLADQARSVADLIDGHCSTDVLGTEAVGVRRSPYLVTGPLAELTRRELEVLRHLAAGESNDQIAARLFISAGTVKTHVKHLLHKLGATNRAEAIVSYHRLTS